MPPHQIWILQTEKRSPPADGGQDPSYLHGPKTTGARQIAGGTDGRHRNPNRLLRRFTHIYCFGFPMLNEGERMRNPAPKDFWLRRHFAPLKKKGRHFAGSFCKSSKGRRPHITGSSILSLVNTSNGYNLSGAAGLVLTLEAWSTRYVLSEYYPENRFT
jgi:hypothetical protein